MSDRSIIRIAAALTGALLLAGCSATLDPTLEEGPIGFSAGSLLLRDDVTKADIKDSFGDKDAFSVYGMRNYSSSQEVVFDGVTVKDTSGTWRYNPVKSWSWTSNSDYYDFVAVYPAGKSARMDIAGDLAVSTHFDVTSDNYDLMAATYRRKGSVQDPCSVVNMEFSHLTSAVQVVVINNSESTAVTVDSVAFRNLMVVGDAKSTLDLYGNDLQSWINLEQNTEIVRDTCYAQSIAAGSRFACTYDFMIPQALNQAVGSGSDEANMPRLRITFTPEGGVQSTANICLKDVTRQDGTAITSWEIGTKYTYYVSMRLDGGLLVSIITTAWDDVEAETPGLLIP